MESKIKQVFPFDSFREKQFDLVVETLHYLYQEDYDNVIIDAPTGVGKSAVNVTAAQLSDKAFYVTPQKSLREQLQEDDVLSEYYEALRGRADYTCGVTGDNCSDCRINQNPKESCSNHNDCTYWQQKLTTMDADMAVLTFAYLIIDGSIPETTESGKVSFGDRDLLIVDECHNLESQVASLFAGFKVSPWTLPMEVFDGIARGLDMDETTRHHQVEGEMRTLQRRAREYVSDMTEDNRELDEEAAKKVEQCEKFLDKVEWFFDEIENGRDWVVEMDITEYGKSRHKCFKLKPVKVDKFLKNFVWSRADKRVLSTATMPYRNNPERWQKQLGLPGKTHVIRTGMPFDRGNRPIHTDCMIASMSNGGIDRHWDDVMASLNDIAEKHGEQKGLVHSASYTRAEDVWKDAGDYEHLKDNVVFDKPEMNTETMIDKWQEGDDQVFVSPATTEGVDLVDEMCRWQVLLKVPFPSPGDPRVEYLLDEVPHIGWDWYYEQTAMAIVQSVGRAVRSKDDYADYYVLDKKFTDIREKVELPEWFEEAIDAEPNHDPAQEGALSW